MDRETYEALVEAVRALDPERVVGVLVEADHAVGQGAATLPSVRHCEARESERAQRFGREVERLALDAAVHAGLDSDEGRRWRLIAWAATDARVLVSVEAIARPARSGELARPELSQGQRVRFYGLNQLDIAADNV